MGRKRKEGARTASGKLSRSKEATERRAYEDSPIQTVMQARRRALNGVNSIEADRRPVTKEQTAALGLNHRGSVLGRWKCDGLLDAAQQQAGEDYCQRYRAYSGAMGLPKPTAQIGAYGAVSGGGRPEDIERTQRAKLQHGIDQRILTQCSAGVMWAMKRACVCDEPAAVHLVSEGLRALVAAKR
jgi:hypothetical protein